MFYLKENSNLLFILGLKLPLIIDNIKINFNFLHSRYKLLIFDARHVKQSLACNGAALVAVLVGEVDDGLDAGLDDHLGALITREQGDVDGASGDVLRVFVEYGIHLRVANIHVFVLQSDTHKIFLEINFLKVKFLEPLHLLFQTFESVFK